MLWETLINEILICYLQKGIHGQIQCSTGINKEEQVFNMPRHIVPFQEEARVCTDLCDHGAFFLRDILQSIYLGKGMEKNTRQVPVLWACWSGPTQGLRSFMQSLKRKAASKLSFKLCCTGGPHYSWNFHNFRCLLNWSRIMSSEESAHTHTHTSCHVCSSFLSRYIDPCLWMDGGTHICLLLVLCFCQFLSKIILTGPHIHPNAGAVTALTGARGPLALIAWPPPKSGLNRQPQSCALEIWGGLRWRSLLLVLTGCHSCVCRPLRGQPRYWLSVR